MTQVKDRSMAQTGGEIVHGIPATLEKTQSPTVAVMQGHSCVQSSGAVTANLTKGAPQEEKSANGPVVAGIQQPRHSGTTFKR